MTDAVKRAQELLRSSDLFTRLRCAMRKAGLVGEKRSALVLYCVAVTRFFSKPLNLFVKGRSSTGKNFLAECVFRLVPKNDVHVLTSSSNRAWNYLEAQLENKVVYIKERNESSGSVHPTRLLISESGLVHYVSVRKGGQWAVERKVTKGPIACVSTTTQDKVEIDDENRHVSVWMDESPEQTRRIARAALLASPNLSEEELETWYEVQNLLRQHATCAIELPSWFEAVAARVRADDVRVRRYFPAFLQACKTICLIRSFRHDASHLHASGKLRVSFVDYATAFLLFNPAFAESLERAEGEDIQSRQVVERISAQKGGKPIRAEDFARHLNISTDRAYARLRSARLAGTVCRANPPERTNRKLYLPAQLGGFLPDPEELFANLDSIRGRAKFIHPLTGEWVTYWKK